MIPLKGNISRVEVYTFIYGKLITSFYIPSQIIPFLCDSFFPFIQFIRFIYHKIKIEYILYKYRF